MITLSKAIKRTIILFAGVLFFFSEANSQMDVTTFLKAGISDANKLAAEYITPFGDAFGSAMNNGWFNTAEAHKPLGFDLTLSMNTVVIPSEFQSFDFNKMGTETLRLKNPDDDPISATIFGKGTNGSDVGVFIPNPLYDFFPGQGHSPDTMLTEFFLPPGSGMNILPMPSLQLRIGIYKNTDISFRFIPEINTPGSDLSGKVGMYGIGLMHDFKQWIPGFNLLPFHMALQGAYTQFKFGVSFPQAMLPDKDYIYENADIPQPSTYDGQGMDYNMTAWNANLLISKKLSVITFYGAFGYAHHSGEMKISGNYPIPVGVYFDQTDYQNPDNGKLTVRDELDPIDITISKGYFRATAGFRLKLSVFTLHADYTYSDYPVISAGLGLSVR